MSGHLPRGGDRSGHPGPGAAGSGAVGSGPAGSGQRLEGDAAGRARTATERLLPASWGRRQRLLAALLVTIVFAAGVTGFETGLLGPRLSEAPREGSFVDAGDPRSIEAGFELRLQNDGLLPVEVVAVDPPELDGVTFGPSPQLPATIDPGERETITVALTAAGCDVNARGLDSFPMVASSGPLPARTVDVEPIEPAEPVVGEVVATDDGERRLPPWSDQPPSWVLEVLAPACSDPAVVPGTDR